MLDRFGIPGSKNVHVPADVKGRDASGRMAEAPPPKALLDLLAHPEVITAKVPSDLIWVTSEELARHDGSGATLAKPSVFEDAKLVGKGQQLTAGPATIWVGVRSFVYDVTCECPPGRVPIRVSSIASGLTIASSGIAHYATDGLSDHMWQWAGREITDGDVCDVLENKHFCRIIGKILGRPSGDSRRRSRSSDGDCGPKVRSAKRVRVAMARAVKIADDVEAADDLETTECANTEISYSGYEDHGKLADDGAMRDGVTDDHTGGSDKADEQEAVQPVIDTPSEHPAAEKRQQAAEQGLVYAEYDDEYTYVEGDEGAEEVKATSPAKNPFYKILSAEKDRQDEGEKSCFPVGFQERDHLLTDNSQLTGHGDGGDGRIAAGLGTSFENSVEE